MAKKSIIVAAVFGLISSLYVVGTGDMSAKTVSETQPMKLAAAEGLYQGAENAPLMAFGILTNTDTPLSDADDKHLVKLEVPVPGMLSLLAYGDFEAFVPGVKDLVEGNPERGIISYYEKIERGYKAQQILAEFKDIKDKSNPRYAEILGLFKDKEFLDNYFKYFGYGSYYSEDQTELKANALLLIPNVPITFYSFHIMVALGFLFIVVFIVFLYLAIKDNLTDKKWLYFLGIVSVPLAFIASEAGWVVAEVGRQPWVIQDLMPTLTAVTKIDSTSVMITFWMFAAIFTLLLIAELKIMLTQIKKGADH